MKQESFSIWALRRLRRGLRCSLEPSMRCLPLEGDGLCTACYRRALKEERNAPEQGPPKA
jgi:hypothetical protein